MFTFLNELLQVTGPAQTVNCKNYTNMIAMLKLLLVLLLQKLDRTKG